MQILTVEINVGHDLNDGSGTLTARDVQTTLLDSLLDERVLGLTSYHHRVAKSTTEITSVIKVRLNVDLIPLYEILEEVSDKLSQDCIAVRVHGEAGTLVGSNAAKWGEFNEQFFIGY